LTTRRQILAHPVPEINGENINALFLKINMKSTHLVMENAGNTFDLPDPEVIGIWNSPTEIFFSNVLGQREHH
jgi:hypothetical protein